MEVVAVIIGVIGATGTYWFGLRPRIKRWVKRRKKAKGSISYSAEAVSATGTLQVEAVVKGEAEPYSYEDGLPDASDIRLRNLFERGKALSKEYRYSEAREAYTSCLALKGISDSQRTALLTLIGNTLYSQAEWKKAERFYQKALKAARKAKDRDGTAAAFGNLGKVYHDTGRWPEAIQSYETALKKFERVPDEHGMAATYNNLGLVYKDKGEWDKAIEFYEKALKGLEKIGDEHGMAQTYNNLGLVYKDKGEWDKAIEFYEKSLEIKKGIGDRHGMAQTKGNIALLYKAQGKKGEARKLFEEILQIFERIGDKPNVDRTRKHLEDL